jgi:hypothetical protein
MTPFGFLLFHEFLVTEFSDVMVPGVPVEMFLFVVVALGPGRDGGFLLPSDQ